MADRILDFIANPAYTRWQAPLLIIAETVLCSLIIWRIPYTEIDWETYMAQIRLFLDGETHYSKITGPTGPLVYPAIHVYLYTALYFLTDRGTSILKAQIIFTVFYILGLSIVLACYRRVNAPPWLLAPLALSKRLHSIFILRCFNDGPAVVMLWLTIYLLQRRKWEAAAVIWSFGLGTKMTLLLAAPGLAFVILQGAGSSDAFFCGMIAFIIQIIVAFPFLNREVGFEYFWRAFDFGRAFLFKWTVNWRFVGADTFASKEFTISLLVLHVSILSVFVQTRWMKPSSTSILDLVKKYTRTMREDEEFKYSNKITPTFVMDTVLGSMVVGLLCARSLHYQFYAYLFWGTPYLLWRSGYGPAWVLAHLAVQELAWNVYPSTSTSSGLVVLELALLVISALIAPPVDHISRPAKPGVKRNTT